MKCEYKAYPWREGSMNVLIWSPEEMTAPLPCIQKFLNTADSIMIC